MPFKFAKLLLSATLVLGVSIGAVAAEKPAAKVEAKPAARQMKISGERAQGNMKDTAAEEGHHQSQSNRINNDAGVPPSGVPSDTMNT